MMNETAIGWCDLSWNVFSGCKKISAGCAHCYADQLAEQRRGTLAFPHGFDLTLRPKNLLDPPRALKAHGPSLIFCESMSDIGLDDDELTPAEIDRLVAAGFDGMDQVRAAFFDAIDQTREHRYQLLTKRPASLLRYLRERAPRAVQRVLASCWLGVTIEHEKTIGRLEYLRAFRALGARVLFVSAEPLLGDVAAALGPDGLNGIDWLIGGGESGAHASHQKHDERFLVRRNPAGVGRPRPWWGPCERDVVWAAGLRDATKAAGAAFFWKQWGGPTPNSGGRLLDGRTWDELPDHVPGAMPPGRRERGAATAALARKLPMVQP